MTDTMTLQQELPDAGWYADPADPRMQRYWAGLNWTDHVRYSDSTSQPISQIPAPAALPEPTIGLAPTTGPTAVWTHMADFNPESAVIAYVPLSTLHSSSRSYAPAWQQKITTPNTGGIWFLALYPAISLAALWLGYTLTPIAYVLAVSASIGGALLVLMLVSAVSDSFTLRQRQVPAPSAGWVLLSPIAYLIARVVTLNQAGIRNSAPIAVFVVTLFLSSAAAAYAAYSFLT